MHKQVQKLHSTCRTYILLGYMHPVYSGKLTWLLWIAQSEADDCRSEVLTIKSKACSVAGPSISMFRKAWAVMTKTVLAASVPGHILALIGLSELMHSTRPGMQSAALNTPAALRALDTRVSHDIMHVASSLHREAWVNHKLLLSCLAV